MLFCSWLALGPKFVLVCRSCGSSLCWFVALVAQASSRERERGREREREAAAERQRQQRGSGGKGAGNLINIDSCPIWCDLFRIGFFVYVKDWQPKTIQTRTERIKIVVTKTRFVRIPAGIDSSLIQFVMFGIGFVGNSNNRLPKTIQS